MDLLPLLDATDSLDAAIGWRSVSPRYEGAAERSDRRKLLTDAGTPLVLASLGLIRVTTAPTESISESLPNSDADSDSEESIEAPLYVESDESDDSSTLSGSGAVWLLRTRATFAPRLSGLLAASGAFRLRPRPGDIVSF